MERTSIAKLDRFCRPAHQDTWSCYKKPKKLNCNFIVQFDRFPATFVAGKPFVTVASFPTAVLRFISSDGFCGIIALSRFLLLSGFEGVHNPIIAKACCNALIKKKIQYFYIFPTSHFCSFHYIV